jgi:hypothetical protein
MFEKVFVVPGAGVKVPLPLPGGGHVPKGGKLLERSFSIERLITSGDLVVGTAPADEPPVTLTTAPAEKAVETAPAQKGKG